MATTSRVIDLTAGLTRARIYVAAHVVAVIQAPSTAGLRIAIEHGDPVSANRGTIIRASAGFEFIELTAVPVAGGTLELAFGDVGDDFTVTSAGDVAFEAVQGAAGPDPWAIQGTVNDPTNGAKLDTLKAAIQAGPFGAGVPFAAQHAAAAGGDAALFDVAGSLGRNSRFGVLRAHPDNVDPLTVEFSGDGLAFSTPVPLLWPGDALSLDGIDLDSLRVTFGAAGDVVIMEAH